MDDYVKPPKIEQRKYSSISAMIVWKNKMFILFLFTLGILYVINVQYAESRIRKVQTLEKEITQLKWRYWTLKSGMMYEGMEEQVGKKVSDKELIIKEEAPKVLIKKSSSH